MRLYAGLLITTVLLCMTSGCGTVFNMADCEVHFDNPANRPATPFGGVGNDVRWMARGIGPEQWSPWCIAMSAVDMPLSYAGDIITLPWIVYKSSVNAPRQPDAGQSP